MMSIVRTTSADKDFKLLVEQLDQELWSRYGEEEAAYAPLNKIENNSTVVLAYFNQQPVGCGCFKTHDVLTAELKRMFVKPEHRGKGVGPAIINELEAWARQLSFSRIVLETGIKQPDAIALYKKSGYVIIPSYPPYDNMETSICMSKSLI